jgi:hypothetical protein
MNSQDNQNWKRKIEELEAELIPPTASPFRLSEKMQGIAIAIKQWFSQLPTPGKVIVAVAGVTISFSVLNTVFRLVTSLVSLAVMGGLLYFGYKFLVRPRS